MKNIISIKNLSFFYDDKEVFKNLNLDIEQSKWITIIGSNGSGKSTLMKLLLGLMQFEGTIVVDNLKLPEDIKQVRKEMGIVFSDPNNQFILDNISDELEFSLRNLNFSEEEIEKRKDEIINEFGLKKLLKLNPKDLSGGEKQLVALAVNLVTNPKILILDESLEMLDFKQKEKVIKIIKKYYKKGMTVINVSQNIEDTLLGDEIIVMEKGNILLQGTKEKVFLEEKKFKELKKNA